MKSRQLAAEIERGEASSPEFAQLRLGHLVMSGIVAFNDEQREEVDLLTAPGPGLEERLEADTDSDIADLRAKALAGVERWRTHGAAPMADATTREACEPMAHTYEGLFVALNDRAPRER